jgi:NitT/TauT family transport system substrate-binding protein
VGVGVYTEAVLSLASQVGIFAKHCLTISQADVANPPAAIAALSGGSADIGYSPSIPIVNAVAAGLPIRVVAPADGFAPDAKAHPDPEVDDSALYVPSGSSIKNAKELEGKTVSVPARKAQLEVTIAGAVKAAGGDPDKIKWVQLDFPTAVAQLKAHKIDAAGLVSPFTDQADKDGDTRLIAPALTFFGPGITVGMWATTQNVVDKKKAALAQFKAAVVEANAYAMSHHAAFVTADAAYTKVSAATINAAKTEFYFPATVSVQDLEPVARQMQALGYLKSVPDLGPVIAQL